MARWVDEHIAHIPIRGANVPDEDLFTLPETSWMPYQWSLNNVVMAENAHTSLAFWEAKRPETGVSVVQRRNCWIPMISGLCPGNLGCMTVHDMARGEAQRDFGDAIGINARALIEGLVWHQARRARGRIKNSSRFSGELEFRENASSRFQF